VTDSVDIRRPELRGVRRSGTVRWFKDEKGYGRVTADDGEVLFVHFSGIVADGYAAWKPASGSHLSGMVESRITAAI
jgi:hypothetical protein